jgi:hypothetical protein|tara:strand:- start:23054 stop:23287 length:234 start_codon:yes stop_codon:yes gene_type:complete
VPNRTDLTDLTDLTEEVVNEDVVNTDVLLLKARIKSIETCMEYVISCLNDQNKTMKSLLEHLKQDSYEEDKTTVMPH